MTPGAGAGASGPPPLGQPGGDGALPAPSRPRLTASAFGAALLPMGAPAFSAAAPHRAHSLTLRLLPVRPRPQTVRNHTADAG